MTPARSLPCPDGNVEGNMFDTAPVRIAASLGLMPAALTCTRTCSTPGTGRSTSSTRSTSIPPNSSYLTAFAMIFASPFGWNSPANAPGALARQRADAKSARWHVVVPHPAAVLRCSGCARLGGLRPAEFENRNGSHPSSLAFVLGEACVAPRLLCVDAIAFRAGQFAHSHPVRLGSAFDTALTGGSQVVIPVRVEGPSAPGREDVDDVRLCVVREIHQIGR